MSTSIARRLVFLVATGWLGVQAWNEAPVAAASTTILESSVLRLEFYPAAGVSSRFEYYTGTGVVPMTRSMSASR